MRKRNQLIASLIAIGITTGINTTCTYAKDEEINDAVSLENQKDYNNELTKNNLELNQNKVTTGAAALIDSVNDNQVIEKHEDEFIKIENSERTLDDYLKSRMPKNSRRIKRYSSFSLFESNKEEIKERIKSGIENYETNIDIKDLVNIDDINNNSNKILDLYFDVMYENPEFFYCSATNVRFGNCSFIPTTGEIKSCDVKVTYEYNNDTIDKMRGELNNKIKDIKQKYLDKCSTNLEREYAIHDYIIQNCTYDKDNYDKKTVPNISHTSYASLVNQIAVCDGYSKATMLLLNEYGIEAGIVTNDGHAWNYVNIDGNYYQIDLTWDDPTPETNKITYKNFNCSDNIMLNIHPWTSTIPGSCTETTYDNLFRTVNGSSVTGKDVTRIKDKLYYLVGADLWKCNLNGTNKVLVKEKITENTTMLNLLAHNKDIYYLSGLEIKKINTDNQQIETFKNLSDEFNFMSGTYSTQFYIRDNKLNIKFGQSPTGTNLKYSSKEYELSGVEDVDVEINNVEEKAPEVVKVNKSDLQALYNANKDKIQGNYTNESWTVFINSLNNVKIILNKENITQSDVNSAIINLESAINSLKGNIPEVINESIPQVIKVNKSELQTLYNTNKNTTQKNYTNESWTVFINSLNNAKSILDKENAMQSDVNSAIINLKVAINNLKSKVPEIKKVNSASSSIGGSRGGSGDGNSSGSSENKIVITNENNTINTDKINTSDSSSLNIVHAVENIAKTLTTINDDHKEIKLNEIYQINSNNLKGNIANLKSNDKEYIYISCESTGDNTNTVKPIKIDVSKLNSKENYIYKLDNVTNKLILINNVQSNTVEIQAQNQTQYIVSNTEMHSLTNNNWNKINDNWIYVQNGQVATGWVGTADSKWYHMNNQGIMQKGWIQDNNKWYHLSNSGYMNTGWFKDTNGSWYYLNIDGSMKTGWLKDTNDNWYYLKPNGSMAVNTTVNGYYINKNGLLR